MHLLIHLFFLNSIDIRQLALSEQISLDALEHIFNGCTYNGKSSGFHVLGMPNAKGRIVVGSERLINAKHAIWEANVTINGILKGAKSSFFPISMNPEQIINAIKEAYACKLHEFKDFYTGITKTGMRIGMYLDKKGKKKPLSL